MIPLDALSECTARFLAATVLELFPKTLLVEGHATFDGFFYTFGFSEEVSEEIFPHIEERMRAAAVEAAPIRETEMMTQNLTEYFRYHWQPLRAALIAEIEEPLSSVISIGSFKDACPLPYPPDTGAFSALKLTHMEALGWDEEVERWIVRINGVVAAGKEELKERLKKRKETKSFNLLEIAAKLGLISSDGKTFLEKGLHYRKSLDQWVAKRGIQEIATSLLDEEGELRLSSREGHLHYFEELREKKGALPYQVTESGPFYRFLPPHRQLPLYNQEEIYSNETHILATEENLFEILNSALQFIQCFITLFSFEGTWRLVRRGKKSKKRTSTLEARYKTLQCALQGLSCVVEEQKESDSLEGSPGWQVQVVVKDLLGRGWIVSTLDLLDETGLSDNFPAVLVEYSLFTSWELLMALQLEKNPKAIPQIPAMGLYRESTS